MKRVTVCGLLAAFALVFALVPVAEARTAGYIDYETYQMDNGLRVIVSEDHSTPIVAVDVWYHVGSAYEEEGRSGLAHLFEHMMFLGSENVGKAEHSQYITRAGGEDNASTTEDRTNYWEVLPANRLNLALWLEADRMRSLNISDESFEIERDNVKEERLQRYENQPYGTSFLTSDTLSLDFAPYSHTVIGKMIDLDNAVAEDARAFFRLYYAPNNAVLTVVGDINPKKTRKLIEKYFGEIPRGREVKPLEGQEPEHDGERRRIIDDPNANVPAAFITYVIPPHLHPDTPALALLGKILTDGESSRLYKRLVKEEEAAVVVFGGADSRKGPGLFRFVTAANVGVDIGRCEELLYDELGRLKREGVTKSELEKAKAQFKADFIRGRETVRQKAEALQHYAYFHDDLADINRDIDRYMAVTLEDIRRVANEYFDEENRTVVIVRYGPEGFSFKEEA
jgi:zinc protease